MDRSGEVRWATVACQDPILQMLGDKMCNNDGYYNGGTWLIYNWLNNDSDVMQWCGKTKVYSVCTNKLGCTCETFFLKQGTGKMMIF